MFVSATWHKRTLWSTTAGFLLSGPTLIHPRLQVPSLRRLANLRGAGLKRMLGGGVDLRLFCTSKHYWLLTMMKQQTLFSPISWSFCLCIYANLGYDIWDIWDHATPGGAMCQRRTGTRFVSPNCVRYSPHRLSVSRSARSRAFSVASHPAKRAWKRMTEGRNLWA